MVWAKRSPHWLMTMLLLDLFTHWWALMGDQTVGSDVWIDVHWLLPLWCIWPLGIYIAFEWKATFQRNQRSSRGVPTQEFATRMAFCWPFLEEIRKIYCSLTRPWSSGLQVASSCILCMVKLSTVHWRFAGLGKIRPRAVQGQLNISIVPVECVVSFCTAFQSANKKSPRFLFSDVATLIWNFQVSKPWVVGKGDVLMST